MMLQNLKIRFRLGLGFGVLMALMVAIATIAVTFSSQTSFSVSEMRRTSKNVVALQQHMLNIRLARALTWYYVAMGEGKALKDLETAFARADTLETQIEANSVSTQTKQLNSAYFQAVNVFKAKVAAILDLKTKGVDTTSVAFTDAANALIAAQIAFATTNDTATRNVEARGGAADDAAQVSLDRSSTWSTAIGITGLLIATCCAWLISRSITRPVGAMTQAMGAIAGGDLTVTVPALSNRDEVGSMAQAVQVFKDAAIEKLRLETEAEALRQVAEHERRQAETVRLVVAEQQAFVVDTLANSLSRLSSGDLTCDITAAFAPEYERLRTDFNAAVTELRGVIGTIVANTSAIQSGTGEISQAADDLSRRTEQQAASLEETAAALDEITATVRKTAEGANATQTIVAAAKSEAEHSETVVREAVTAMSAIDQSAREISQIIGVIDEIAFQTNLLALNAGVEAARAGDAGRGFAVVASEVRALAQRSAQAAKEIKVLIGNSTSHVGRGVTLVSDTGSALGRILAQVRQINDAVSDIAASAQEQATGLAQVNTAVNQMDQVTQQNAAMVEQSTAASHSLANDAAELQALTARFDIGGKPPSSAVVDKKTTLAKASRAAAARPLRMVANNTALKSKPNEDAWEEF